VHHVEEGDAAGEVARISPFTVWPAM